MVNIDYWYTFQGILEDRKRELDGQSNEEGGEDKTVEDEENGGQADEDDLAVGKEGGKLRALIMTPTRELAIQIKDHIQVLFFLLWFPSLSLLIRI